MHTYEHTYSYVQWNDSFGFVRFQLTLLVSYGEVTIVYIIDLLQFATNHNQNYLSIVRSYTKK